MRQGDQLASLLAGSIVGSILLVASTSKALDLGSFVSVVRRFPVARLVASDDSKARILAVLVIALELVLGLCLVTGTFQRQASEATVVLLLAFVLGLTAAVIKGQELHCGCLGSRSGGSVGAGTILRNVALVALALVAAAGPSYGLTGFLAGELSLTDFLKHMAIVSQTGLLTLTLVESHRLRQFPHFVTRPSGRELDDADVWTGIREPGGVRR